MLRRQSCRTIYHDLRHLGQGDPLRDQPDAPELKLRDIQQVLDDAGHPVSPAVDGIQHLSSSLWRGAKLGWQRLRDRLGLPVGVPGAHLPDALDSLLRDYQKARILSVMDPQRDPRGTGYQTIQSVIAVGSGGFSGRGLGNGSQGALGFLPERHTDFIYALVGEELGFIGAVVVLLLYALFLYRGLNIALETRDKAAMYAATGIVMLYAVHMAINMGMTLGLLPVIGIPLPPLSYGGSSVVPSFIALGLLNKFQIHRYHV